MPLLSLLVVCYYDSYLSGKKHILFYKITEISRTPVKDSKKLPGEIFKRAIPTDLAKTNYMEER